MKLVYPEIKMIIEIKENIVNCIIIENQKFLSKLIYELYNQCQGKEGRFVLSSENKILKISKNMELVINPFVLNLNDRVIINKLYKELDENILGEEMFMEVLELKKSSLCFIEKLKEKTEYPIVFSEDFNNQNFFKLMELKLCNEDSMLIDRLVAYLKVYSELIGIEIFAFLNLKSLLSSDELEKLFLFCDYQKIKVILFEGKASGLKSEKEIRKYIDYDLCEIF